MSTCPDRNGGSLRTDLQALVDDVGLEHGKVKVKVHQGSIHSVKVKFTIRLIICQTKSQKPNREPTQIRVSEVVSFVHQHLQPLIPDLTGRFGSFQVNVKAGRVVDWSFRRRQR